MESGLKELPLTLCAGVGKVVVPVPAAATEPDEPREGSEEVAGENCEGLWGVWGWKDIMNQGSSRGTRVACRARPGGRDVAAVRGRAEFRRSASYTRPVDGDGLPGVVVSLRSLEMTEDELRATVPCRRAERGAEPGVFQGFFCLAIARGQSVGSLGEKFRCGARMREREWTRTKPWASSIQQLGRESDCRATDGGDDGSAEGWRGEYAGLEKQKVERRRDPPSLKDEAGSQWITGLAKERAAQGLPFLAGLKGNWKG